MKKISISERNVLRRRSCLIGKRTTSEGKRIVEHLENHGLVVTARLEDGERSVTTTAKGYEALKSGKY